MDELTGIVERDSWCHGPLDDGSWTVYGQSASMAEHTEMAFADRRYLLGLLREARTALTQTTEQLVLEHGPIGRDRECSGCRADDLRDSSRGLLARLAALGEPHE